jgi:hypothetical protein
MEDMKIKSPWGDASTSEPLTVIRTMLNQLKTYKKNKTSPNPGKLDRDILGYETILEADVPENAVTFLDYKADYREKGITVDNAQVVEAMKSRGDWVEKKKVNE